MPRPTLPDDAASHRPLFVWHSTQESVERGIISALAAGEVVLSVLLYWWIAVWFQSQAHLWISIAVAPLLLLRSKESIALGARWFDHYVDAGFGRQPHEAIRSPQLWVASLASLAFGFCSIYFGARLLLTGDVTLTKIILGVMIGYLGTQGGAAVALAIAANEISAVVTWKRITVTISILVVAIAVLGVVLSGIGFALALSVIAPTVLLGAVGITQANDVTSAVTRMDSSVQEQAKAVTGAKAIVADAPLASLSLALGVLLGGWLRSLAIRFAATARYFWVGFLEFPRNWRRTLFATDVLYPPEIVPGYERQDIFQVSYLIDEIRKEAGKLDQLIYIMALVVMFVPAYIYRLTIKSTCWFYIPIIYFMRPLQFSRKPELLADLAWNTPLEWWRRLLAALVLASFFFRQLISVQANAVLPAVIVSPLEYVFLIDLTAVKPWQWFNLASAAITAAIFICAGSLRIFARHARSDSSLEHHLTWRALFVEHAMRVRNFSTALFLLIAFFHVLFWQMPHYIPKYIFSLFERLFGP